jgi:MFS family permease
VLLSVFGTVMLLPVLLFAPFAGPWVDRWNLRRTLLTSDTLRAVLVAVIPLAYGATQSVNVVFAIVFLLFTCNVFFLPAKSAMTPEIVPPEQLLAANTLLSVAGILATALGAIAGGWLVDHWGWTTAMWVNAASYLVSVGSLALIPTSPTRSRQRPEMNWRAYLGKCGRAGGDAHNRGVELALIAPGAVWVAAASPRRGQPAHQHAASGRDGRPACCWRCWARSGLGTVGQSSGACFRARKCWAGLVLTAAPAAIGL